MTVELLGEAPEDSETVFISWLKPMLAVGSVVNTRRAGAPLPCYVITHLSSVESVDESWADALVQVDVLTHKAAGEVVSRDETDRMHRRMLLLARELPDVDLGGGRMASIESLKVFASPTRQKYGDDLILRRVGRYTIGLSYAEAQ